jgi:hypothetical protein
MVVANHKEVTVVDTKNMHKIASGAFRLRHCMAKVVAEFAEQVDCLPEDLGAMGNIPHKPSSSITGADGNHELKFTDFSKLVYLKDIKQWGIYYPSWVRTVYVPKDVPQHKDGFGTSGCLTEASFHGECKQALTNPNYVQRKENQNTNTDGSKKIVPDGLKAPEVLPEGVKKNMEEILKQLDEAQALDNEQNMVGCG